ncbi:hypothetical protein [Listeria costaricensis]|uniref:hypothetical protein n=1 Tax=Listeria costaricensis TaxID=2026604 RepID=UPI0013C407DA|nr:hypothetical protein [Listeria costaricensis]
MHAIFSRSYDGFVRQKHLHVLTTTDFPEWARAIPYIVKICDEYVVEILQMVYQDWARRDTTLLKKFCATSQSVCYRSYQRMVSYWNEYYRNDCFKFQKYVGRKLFMEYFGMTHKG